MRVATILFALFTSISCTGIEVREFIAEPIPALEAKEVSEVFATFRLYLGFMGYEPRSPEDMSDPKRAAYRISAPQSDFQMWTNQDVWDYVELEYEGGETFIVRMVRIHHGGHSISEENLKYFVSETEKFVLESTERRVKLRAVVDSR